MFFFGMTDPQLRAEIARKVQEQEEILQLMMVLPAYYEYKSHPTYDQVAPLYYEAEAAGYTFRSLYYIFSSGTIPPDLDALIRKHAEHWRPAGKIVESNIETRVINALIADPNEVEQV